MMDKAIWKAKAREWVLKNVFEHNELTGLSMYLDEIIDYLLGDKTLVNPYTDNLEKELNEAKATIAHQEGIIKSLEGNR